MRALTNILLLGHLAICFCADYPCYTNWTYSQISGNCYYLPPDTVSYASALSTCKSQLASFPGSVKMVGLTKIESVSDANGLSYTLIDKGNNAPMWLDLAISGGTFTWSNGATVNTTLLSSIASVTDFTGPCLTITYTYTLSGSGSSLGYQIASTSCSDPVSFLCQHKAVACSPDNIPMYSGSAMVLIPPSYTVGSRPYISCLTGYYRATEIQIPPVVSEGQIPMNYANCTGAMGGDLNPFQYSATWVLNNTQRLLEVCLQVACPIFSGILVNVQRQIIVTSTQTSYNFGDSFTVPCVKGFVSYAEEKNNNASVVCSQSLSQKQVGIWNPVNNIPCVPVVCNYLTLLNMVPAYGSISSAKNRASQAVFNASGNLRRLTYYDNIFTFNCKNGYFFSDRNPQKMVICGLKNNSLVIGEWQGYLGTNLPLDTSCQNATCTFESIIIQPTMNLQTSFYMLDSTGAYQNVSQPSVNPYPYLTQMRFICLPGYSAVSKTPDQNLTCGPQGKWFPALTPCVQVTDVLQLGNQLHFVPPPTTSVSAQNVGYMVILILVIFLSLIVILDVSTISRDIKILRTNMKNVKRFINRHKA